VGRFHITPQRHYPLQQPGVSSLGVLPPVRWDGFRKKNILSPRNSPAALSPGSTSQGGGAVGGGRDGASSGLLSPLLPGAAGGGGSLSAMSSMDTSIEIDSCDSDDNSESPESNDQI